MAGGFVKLPREYKDRQFGSDVMTMWILLELHYRAKWKDGEITWEGKRHPLKRGQCLISVDDLAKDAKVSRMVIRSRLKSLTNEAIIQLQTSHKGAIVTLNYYDDLQDDCETEKPQLSHNLATKKPHTKNEELIIKKEELVSSLVFPPPPSAASPCQESLNNSSPNFISQEFELEMLQDHDPSNTCAHEEQEMYQEPKKERKKRVKKEGQKEPRTAVIKPDGSLVWDAYAKAYQELYKVPPVRNAKTNSLCKTLVQYLGAEAAPQVATFYLGSRDRYIVGRVHPLSLLVNDAQRFHTEWLKGERMTSTFATRIDKTQTQDDVYARALESIKQMKKEKHVN